MKAFTRLLGILFVVAASLAAQEVSRTQSRLYNPYERPKNGPPLTKIFHKAEPSWLFAKLRNPRHHPAARMPDFKFTEQEALDILAYLKSIAGDPFPRIPWPPWAAKGFEEMNEAEFAALDAILQRGKTVWNEARCSICHSVNGPGGRIIGGFVDLRVGGIDLQIAGTKLKRDWLYAWIKEPKSYFPDTLMPRYRFSDAEIKALVEYILRDEAFLPATEAAEESPEFWRTLEESARVSRGRRLIEFSRCVLCHDIQGIPELLRLPELTRPATTSGFEFLAYDLRCLSCHSIEGRGGTYAPDLTGEGSRIRESWIEQFVKSPDMVRPLSQQMPKFNLTAEEARVVASYLSQQRRDARIPADIPGGPVTGPEIENGREAFRGRGCVACHAVGEGPGGVVGPDLTSVADRLRPGYLWFHLQNPHTVNPYSAEPDFGLSESEARGLAGYLGTKKK